MSEERDRLLAAADKFVHDHIREVESLAELSKTVVANKQEIARLEQELALYEEARVFLQELAREARDEVVAGLETIVTLCLQLVFGEDMRFAIDVDTKRNTTSVEFKVIDTSGEEEVENDMEDDLGGGVVDAVTIGLRYGRLKLLHPTPPGPMMLDEPAKMVSGDLLDSIAQLLKQLTAMFGKQTLLVTHHVTLRDIVDRAIFVRKERGISRCIQSDREDSYATT